MDLARELHELRARRLSRRWFLRDCTLGLGGIALGSLLQGESRAAVTKAPVNPLTPRAQIGRAHV